MDVPPPCTARQSLFFRNIKKAGDFQGTSGRRGALTASYISQAERNLAEPSLSSLRKLAAALQVPLYFFLEDDMPQTQVIRANQRCQLALPDSDIVYEYLSPLRIFDTAPPKLEVILFRLKPQCWSREDYARHETAEECIMVLSDVVTVDCLNESYQLCEGDSVYIRQGIPHRIYNPSNSEAVALMCLSPPVY